MEYGYIFDFDGVLVNTMELTVLFTGGNDWKRTDKVLCRHGWCTGGC
jgi:hypothetical protein